MRLKGAGPLLSPCGSGYRRFGDSKNSYQKTVYFHRFLLKFGVCGQKPDFCRVFPPCENGHAVYTT
jgi:hypothetical protein